jgi:putative tricarboxylic transport membrane protein
MIEMNFKKNVLADIAVLAALSLFTSWYLWEAWGASNSVENLIFILPIAVLTLLMCTLELIKQLFSDLVEANKPTESMLSVLPVIILFAVYVLSLEWVGFDVGTVLFVASFLFLQGERRVVWLIAYSLVFGIVVALFFSNMLPYPMPMTFIATDY